MQIFQNPPDSHCRPLLSLRGFCLVLAPDIIFPFILADRSPCKRIFSFPMSALIESLKLKQSDIDKEIYESVAGDLILSLNQLSLLGLCNTHAG